MNLQDSWLKIEFYASVLYKKRKELIDLRAQEYAYANKEKKGFLLHLVHT